MNKKLLLSLIALLSLLLTACSTSDSTSTAVVAGSQSPTISSPLLGTYTTKIDKQDIRHDPSFANDMGTWTIIFRGDGTFTITSHIGVATQGRYKVTSNRLIYVQDALCTGGAVANAQSSTYTWRLQGTQLFLASTTDRCADRELIDTAHPWVKLGTRA